MDSELIGIWKSDPNAEISKQHYGSVIIEFMPNGILVYRIFEGGKEQIIKLTYEIRGNKLVTDQPSSPKKESTEFRVVKNKLILDFEGIESVFTKIS
jgi:hypothetical protein